MKITKDNVFDLLARAVKDYGEDWVDPLSGSTSNCQYLYNYDGTPRRCIAGQVFHYVGITDEELEEMNEYGGLRDGCGAEDIAHDLCDDFAFEVLASAQVHQDDGNPWGSVYTFALEES